MDKRLVGLKLTQELILIYGKKLMFDLDEIFFISIFLIS